MVAAAEARGITLPAVETFHAEPGYGLTATVLGHVVQVGAERWMEKLGIAISAGRERMVRLAAQAKTPILAAIDGKLAAVLAVADPVKAGSREAVLALRALGLEPVMVTGDALPTAQAVARAVGIERVLAERLPRDKAREIEALQREGQVVAFAGDGINDAIALAQADVGIAMGTGTDIAIEAGDVILMRGDLRVLVDAVALSRRALRIDPARTSSGRTPTTWRSSRWPRGRCTRWRG